MNIPPSQHELGYTVEECRKIVGIARWVEFCKWFDGQTGGVTESGVPVIYQSDLERFMRGLRPAD